MSCGLEAANQLGIGPGKRGNRKFGVLVREMSGNDLPGIFSQRIHAAVEELGGGCNFLALD